MSERPTEPGDARLDTVGIGCTVHDVHDICVTNQASAAAEPSRKETSL